MNALRITALLTGMLLCPPVWAQSVSTTLTLQSAIQQALQGSPAISSAKAALSAAQGAEIQSTAFNNPEISLEVENLAGNGDYRGTNSAEYTYSLSQKLEIGGKRTHRQSLTGAERQATDKELQATQLNTIRDVTIAYTDVLALQEKLNLAISLEELAKDVQSNVSKRVSAARDPLIYKNQADVTLATARLQHQKAIRDLQLAKRKLASHWGSATLTEELDLTVLTSSIGPQPLDVYQEKLANNPDLQRQNDIRSAKTAALKLEKTQNIPDPSFSVGLRDFKETGHQAMVAGISMPIPLFNRNNGNITRAASQVTQAEQDAKQANIQAQQALHEAWLDWQSAHTEATELQTNIIPSAEEALTLSRQGYERGRFSFLEVLNAQRTLAEAQEQRINALQRKLNAKAIVERLTPTIPTPTGDQ